METSEEDLYFNEMKKKIIFMKKRLLFLEEMRIERYSDTNKYINKLYKKYDFTPFENTKCQCECKNDIFKFKYNKKVKIDKIYKKLTLVCHPDKNGHDFIKLQKFYENKDLYELMCMAYEYKIDLKNTNEPEMHFLLEKKLYTLKTQIKTIVNSDEYPFIIDDEIGIKNYTTNLIKLMEETKKLREDVVKLKEIKKNEEEKIKNYNKIKDEIIIKEHQINIQKNKQVIEDLELIKEMTSKIEQKK